MLFTVPPEVPTVFHICENDRTCDQASSSSRYCASSRTGADIVSGKQTETQSAQLANGTNRLAVAGVVDIYLEDRLVASD